jgi:hypothetical protein
MEQTLHITFNKAVLLLTFFLLSHSAFAQPVPELVFRNPVLEQGIDGEDGAVYRFRNITKGIDGLLKIKKRSEPAVVLEDIDVAGTGWENALQPRLGVRAGVPANQIWWMQFELQFVQRNSIEKATLNRFVATPIDVDGDNMAIREFLQMDGLKEIAYSPLTYLKTEAVVPEPIFSARGIGGADEDQSINLSETDGMIVGPLTSFADIDTTATAVMATCTYENRDVITFTMGATFTGAIENPGMAGLRLHSLWFKQFSLEPQKKQPVTLEAFTAVFSGKAIMLNWKTSGEQGLSHFVIERSVNGRNYSDIAVVFATGNEKGATYSYKEKPVTMPAGIAYYRLRMVDSRRSASHSFVSTVHAKEAKNVKKVVVFSGAEKGNTRMALTR